MYFEKPGLLWALFALLLPILYHLFSLRPSRRGLVFSSAFIAGGIGALPDASPAFTSAYCCFCACFACFFWYLLSPSLIFLPKGHALRTTHVVVYVDNSLSMSVAHESTDRPAFEQAIDYARRIVQRYGEETQVAIMTNDNTTGVYERQKEALRRLSSLRYSAYRLRSDEVQSRLAPLLITSKRGGVYLLAERYAGECIF